MRCTLKKAVTFSLAMIMIMVTLMPGINTYAKTKQSEDYAIKVIAENEYTDGVRFGDGYLLLKDGKFNEMTSKTIFTFIDEKGNEKDIKNSNGVTEAYLTFAADYKFVDYGVLAVGKDGKMALMDSSGMLYGGDSNYHIGVSYAGKDLFYTTDKTEISGDKIHTRDWTLRKKDGTIIKEFKDFNLNDRVYVNGYEFISYKENYINKFIKVDSNGIIEELDYGYDYFERSLDGEYFILQGYYDYNSYKVIFNSKGNKLGIYENLDYINLNNLSEKGYAKMFFYGDRSSQNIMNSEGKLMLEHGKYSNIDFDSERILTVDYEGNKLLKDHNNNIIFDCGKFIKDLGASLSHFKYQNSILSVSLNNTEFYPESGTSFIFDKDGNQTAGPLRGHVQQSMDNYFVLQDSYQGEYALVNAYGEVLKQGYGYLSFEYGASGGKIIASDYDYESNKTNLILKDGSIINKYDQVNNFINGIAIVRNKDKFGVIDNDGNEIITCGQYDSFNQMEASDKIVSYKDGLAYLFDRNGNIISSKNELKEVGRYKSIFGDETLGIIPNYIQDYNIYTNTIHKDNKALIIDQKGMLGLIQIKEKEMEDVDGDGVVDIGDIAAIATKYNKTNKDSGWDSKLDLNKDEIIDLYDITKVSIKL